LLGLNGGVAAAVPRGAGSLYVDTGLCSESRQTSVVTILIHGCDQRTDQPIVFNSVHVSLTERMRLWVVKSL